MAEGLQPMSGLKNQTWQYLKEWPSSYLTDLSYLQQYINQLVSFSSQKKKLSRLSVLLKTLCMRWEV